MEGRGNGFLRHYPGISLDGLGKTMKSLTQDSRSPGRDLNPGLPEYKVGVLTTLLRRYVHAFYIYVFVLVAVTIGYGPMVDLFEDGNGPSGYKNTENLSS
jgi:hypothetical protein